MFLAGLVTLSSEPSSEDKLKTLLFRRSEFENTLALVRRDSFVLELLVKLRLSQGADGGGAMLACTFFQEYCSSVNSGLRSPSGD